MYGILKHGKMHGLVGPRGTGEERLKTSLEKTHQRLGLVDYTLADSVSVSVTFLKTE